MQRIESIWQVVKENVGSKFKSSTMNFILIMVIFGGISVIFGMENLAVGLITSVLMLSLMMKDLTASPFKHFCLQAAFLCLMSVAAAFAMVMPPVVALIINFTMLFIILYVNTYECGEHFYFQYTLGYLFLLFLSPITPEQLPKRMVAMVMGSVCLIVYQLVQGRTRAADTTREVFVSLLEETEKCVGSLLAGKNPQPDIKNISDNLSRLSKSIDHRRKKTLCISDNSFALIEIGQNLEQLTLLISETRLPIDEDGEAVLRMVASEAEGFKKFILKEKTDIPIVKPLNGRGSQSREAKTFYKLLTRIRELLLVIPQTETHRKFRETTLSFTERLKMMVDTSPVRLAYALRVAVLLAVFIMLVQYFELAHGRWLLFTLASVSLPYADDVSDKAKNRMLATMIGCIFSMLVFSMIPSPVGRMAVAMLAGYVSFYMNGYLPMFACSTIGALGGTMPSAALGWEPVGEIVLIRLGYILLGIIIAIIFNCLILPVRRKDATDHLRKRYLSVTRTLSKMYREENRDLQLYYNSMIYMQLLENKICQNAAAMEWDGAAAFIKKHKRSLRHRRYSWESK